MRKREKDKVRHKGFSVCYYLSSSPEERTLCDSKRNGDVLLHLERINFLLWRLPDTGRKMLVI